MRGAVQECPKIKTIALNEQQPAGIGRKGQITAGCFYILLVFSYKNALTFAFGYMMIIEKQMSTVQSGRQRQEKISLSRRLS